MSGVEAHRQRWGGVGGDREVGRGCGVKEEEEATWKGREGGTDRGGGAEKALATSRERCRRWRREAATTKVTLGEAAATGMRECLWREWAREATSSDDG